MVLCAYAAVRLLGGVMGMDLPGPGSILLGKQITFPAPCKYAHYTHKHLRYKYCVAYADFMCLRYEIEIPFFGRPLSAIEH